MDTDLFDENLLLEPESHYYDEGYKEGVKESTQESLLEGKELGIQTGFQRFVIIGILKRLCMFLDLQIDSNHNEDIITLNNRKKSYKRIHHQLMQVRKSLDVLFDKSSGLVSVVNSDSEVAKFDRLLRLSRAVIRSICSSLGYSDLYEDMENGCLVVGKKIPVSGLTASTQEW